MNKKKDIDIEAAHKYFSVACFNKAWDLIDKTDRTPEEDDQMIRLSMASHWHWTQREDYAPQNASIAYWQLSRIYAILARGEEARKYGLLCLNASQAEDIAAFYLGYAYEALALAEMVSGDTKRAQEYLKEAHSAAGKITDRDEKKLLLGDLSTIGSL